MFHIYEYRVRVMVPQGSVEEMAKQPVERWATPPETPPTFDMAKIMAVWLDHGFLNETEYAEIVCDLKTEFVSETTSEVKEPFDVNDITTSADILIPAWNKAFKNVLVLSEFKKRWKMMSKENQDTLVGFLPDIAFSGLTDVLKNLYQFDDDVASGKALHWEMLLQNNAEAMDAIYENSVAIFRAWLNA